MTQTQVQLRNVTYNAANQSFEALATVTSQSGTRTHPCFIEAPVTMSFEGAAKGLETQALRNDTRESGLSSQMRHRVVPVRAGRQRFGPRAWLAQLGFGNIDKAA